MINGDTIRTMGIIHGAAPSQFRPVGYDFTVGQIYVPRDRDSKLGQTLEEYEIPPQGIVVLFSEESLELPGHICGMAMPKTSLCDEGVLVFNTGLVDPNYKGKLSGTTVNFRKTPYRIKKGDPFLRIVFEDLAAVAPCPNAPLAPTLIAKDHETYRDRKILRAQEFPHTFLDVPGTAEIVTEKVMKKERDHLLWTLGIMALFFAAIQIVTAFAPNAVEQSQFETQKKEIDKLSEDFAKGQKAADDRIKALTLEITKLSQTAAPQTTPLNPPIPVTPPTVTPATPMPTSKPAASKP